MTVHVPFTLRSTDSDDDVNPPTIALHAYDPLSDCCIGLNCSLLEVAVNMIFKSERLSSTGVLPSGGPSH